MADLILWIFNIFNLVVFLYDIFRYSQFLSEALSVSRVVVMDFVEIMFYSRPILHSSLLFAYPNHLTIICTIILLNLFHILNQLFVLLFFDAQMLTDHLNIVVVYLAINIQKLLDPLSFHLLIVSPRAAFSPTKMGYLANVRLLIGLLMAGL